MPLGDAVGAGNLDRLRRAWSRDTASTVVPLQYVSAATLIKLLGQLRHQAGRGPRRHHPQPAAHSRQRAGAAHRRRYRAELRRGLDARPVRRRSIRSRTAIPNLSLPNSRKSSTPAKAGSATRSSNSSRSARMNADSGRHPQAGPAEGSGNWIRRLDSADTMRTGVHVYHVKYGEARQIARVLNDMFVGAAGPATWTAPQTRSRPAPAWPRRSSGDRLSGQSAARRAASARGQAGAGGSDARSGFGATQPALGRDRKRDGGCIPGSTAAALRRRTCDPAQRSDYCRYRQQFAPHLREPGKLSASSSAPGADSIARNCRSRSTPPSPRSRSTTI